MGKYNGEKELNVISKMFSQIWEKICNQQGRDPDANDPDETIQSRFESKFEDFHKLEL